MRRRSLYAACTVSAALLASPAAFGSAGPRLTPSQVTVIALLAAAPYVNISGHPSGGPVTVERVVRGHDGKQIVWLVHVHAASFRMGCEHAPPFSYCIPYFGSHALVTIADGTGTVRAVTAAPA